MLISVAIIGALPFREFSQSSISLKLAQTAPARKAKNAVTCSHCLNTIERVVSAVALLDSNDLVARRESSFPASIKNKVPATPQSKISPRFSEILRTFVFRPQFILGTILVIGLFLLFAPTLRRAPSVGENRNSKSIQTDPNSTDHGGRSVPQSVATNKDSAVSSAPAAGVLAVVLTPGERGKKGGHRNIVELPSGRYEIQLKMQFGPGASSSYPAPALDGYASIRAHIQRTDGKIQPLTTNVRLEHLADGTRLISCTVDSNVVTSGEYSLVLIGVDPVGKTEDIGGYSSSVVPKKPL